MYNLDYCGVFVPFLFPVHVRVLADAIWTRHTVATVDREFANLHVSSFSLALNPLAASRQIDLTRNQSAQTQQQSAASMHDLLQATQSAQEPLIKLLPVNRSR